MTRLRGFDAESGDTSPGRALIFDSSLRGRVGAAGSRKSDGKQHLATRWYTKRLEKARQSKEWPALVADGGVATTVVESLAPVLRR